MSDQCCEYEPAVVRAARAGAWDKSLDSHAQTCPVCAEAIRVHAAMFSLVTSEQIPPIPDPKLVWLKAQFAERQRKSLIITRIAAAAYAILLGALGFAAYSLFGDGASKSNILQLTDSLTSSSAAPAALIIACIVLALFLSAPSAKRSR